MILSTKSTLILRDLDLLSRIAKDSWCSIGVTVTTLDRKLVRFLEPEAPAPEERLNVVKELKTSALKYKPG